MVIWSLGQLHPSRVLGLIGVNTPFMARSPLPPTQLLTRLMGPEHYIVHFQKPATRTRAWRRTCAGCSRC